MSKKIRWITETALLLALLTLGGKWGSCAIMVYLALGAVGLPVFSGFQGSAALLGPTGGYLVGFVFFKRKSKRK